MSLTMDVVLQQARPVLPVLVIEDISLAVDLARALHAGGIRVLEVTLRTPRALDALAAMKGGDMVTVDLDGYKVASFIVCEIYASESALTASTQEPELSDTPRVFTPERFGFGSDPDHQFRVVAEDLGTT